MKSCLFSYEDTSWKSIYSSAKASKIVISRLPSHSCYFLRDPPHVRTGPFLTSRMSSYPLSILGLLRLRCYSGNVAMRKCQPNVTAFAHVGIRFNYLFGITFNGQIKSGDISIFINVCVSYQLTCCQKKLQFQCITQVKVG